MNSRFRFLVVITSLALGSAVAVSQLFADEPVEAPADAQDFFDAMDAGDIEAKLIVRDIQNARLVVRNKTKQPMTIKLPEAIAALPVLAQGQGGGGGGGGGFFNVPPEKVAKKDIPFVCLEHGKPDPRSTTPYTIGRIEQITTNPAVIEVVKGLGKGTYSHEAAQAACWHLQNDMSWQELASKEWRQLNRPARPYFSRDQMERATRIVAHVKKIVEESGQSESLATSSSLAD